MMYFYVLIEQNTLSTYYKSKKMYLKESVKRALRAYTEATRVASNPQEIETDKEAKDSSRLVSLVLGLPEPENIFGPIDDGEYLIKGNVPWYLNMLLMPMAIESTSSEYNAHNECLSLLHSNGDAAS